MSLNREKTQSVLPDQAGSRNFSLVPSGLKIIGGLLLLAGFAGPWVYGPLGRTADWGWQPVWGMLLSFWGINLFIVFSAISCFSYVELYYRLGRRPIAALLKWIGGFLALIFLVPLGAWLLVDQSQRASTPRNADGALGWGVWLALAGLVLLVVGLRLQIAGLRKTLNIER